jgi:hypothetical protein
MSCDNPFGGSIFARDGRPHSGLRVVPDAENDVPAGNAEREAPVLPAAPEREEPPARTEAAVVLAGALPGTERSAVARSLASLKRWGKQCLTANPYKRGLASMVRSRLHKMHAGQPGSIDSHRAHVKAAAWFPEELEGSWLKWVRFAWTAFHVTWCRFLKILGSTFSSAGDHARTAFALLVVVIILIVYFA